MFENLKLLYLQYGGIGSLGRSGYFWMAVALTVLSFQSIWTKSWITVTIGVMPSLTGFTIAAFAIIFTVLDQETLKKLVPVGEDGTSPVLRVAAAIGHTVFIQVSSLVLALLFSVVDLKKLSVVLGAIVSNLGVECFNPVKFLEFGSYVFSGFGLFLTYYGVLLVLAAIFSIFRMQLIVARAIKKSN